MLLTSRGPTMEPQWLSTVRAGALLRGGESERTQRLRAEDAQHRGQESEVTEKSLKLICIDPTDNSGPMTNFIQSAPRNSLLLMVTHDDGSSR